jgi:ecotin
MMKTILYPLFLLSMPVLPAVEHPQLEPFPPAEEGMSRSVIVMSEKANEEDLKVEIIVGQVRKTDGVNIVRMGGSLNEETLKGWGYTYFVAEPGPVMSTLMAPPPGQEEVEAFVAMPGKLVRYSSKLPIVVYTPEGYEVRYRIWTAGEERQAD